ncbi:MAG TPA: hypothetical protein VD931_14875, partial [Baekduia sp.]|nr:hypothetical protein [Baekduia sp.]
MSATAAGVPLELLQRTVRDLCAIERPSASDGERQAAELVADLLRAEGCSVRVEEERAHGGYWWPVGLLNAAAAMTAAGALRGRASRGRRLLAAVVNAAAAAGVADDITGGRHWVRRAALPYRTTWNVVAETGPADASRVAVVVAHHDAAHGGVVFDPRAVYALQRRHPALFEQASRHPPVMGLVVLGPVLAAAGALLGRRGLLRAGAVVAGGTAAAMVDIARAPVAPAANDNASAVAALVGVARALRDDPAGDVRVLL